VESESPIVEFTAVSPQRQSKGKKRKAEQLSREELEKEWENEVSQLIEEADDVAAIKQDPKAQAKLTK
jgi:hypothetical protein